APYTWSINGSLPPGLNLSSNVILGTPTTPGAYNFIVTVVDARQASNSRSFSITIGGTGGGTGKITISPASLPSGTVGQVYPQTTLIASGGTAPYSWKATQGLPVGLVLDATTGILSGTPTTAGTYNVTIQASDSAQLTGTAPFTLL